MVFNTLHLAIIIFLAVSVIFAGSAVLISMILAPRTKGGDYTMPYECGMRPHRRAWGNFHINYYVYALIFISFDVDVLYLFPISAYYKMSQGLLAFYEVSYFLFFVLLAVLYFRAKGVFSWPRQLDL